MSTVVLDIIENYVIADLALKMNSICLIPKAPCYVRGFLFLQPTP